MKNNVKPKSIIISLFIMMGMSALPTHLLWGQCPPGNVTLSNQAQVYAFAANYPSCTAIVGTLKIGPSTDISDLSVLSNLITIGGGLTLLGNEALSNLNGLNNIASVGGGFSVQFNTTLTNFSGLDNLSSIGGSAYVENNNALTSFSGLESLTYIGSFFWIRYNGALTSFNGLNNTSSIGGNFTVKDINNFTNFSGLDNLTSIGGTFRIESCTSLTNFSGLGSLSSIGGSLEIYGDVLLSSFSGLDNLELIGSNLNVEGTVLTNFSGLDNLSSLGGSLIVTYTQSLTNFSGLNSITSIGGEFSISNNNALMSFSGLDNVTSIGSEFYIYGNLAITNFTGLGSLNTIGGNFTVWSHAALTNFSGLNNLTTIGGQFAIFSNGALTDFSGLNNLTAIGATINVSQNGLTSFNGLENLTSTLDYLVVVSNGVLMSLSGLENINLSNGAQLIINNNPNLSICDVQSICDYLSFPANSANISGNATGCNNRVEVEMSCASPEGCTNTFQWPGFAYPLNNNAAPITISICNFEGDYSEIPDAVAGMTLQFNSTAPNDIITVRAGTPSGPVLAFGALPLTFDNTYTGPIYAHWNLPGCGTGGTCRTTTVQCLNCDTPVANDVCEGAIPLNCGQTVIGTTYGARVDFVNIFDAFYNPLPGIPVCGVHSPFPAQGVWYSFVGTGASETIALQSASFEAKISVYSGNCSNLVCAPYSTNGNQVTVATTAGVYYYVLVYGPSVPDYGAFALQLLDNTPPVPTCKSHSVVLGTNGTANVQPSDVYLSSTDNCGEVGILGVSPNSFNCGDVGENTVTLTVTDESGNTATCTAIVTVQQYPFEASLPSCKTVYFGYQPAACTTISSNISGGQAPFSYLWSTGETSSSILYCATSPSSPSPFSLVVTDQNGCTATPDEATIVEVKDVRCGNNNNKVQVCHINGNGVASTKCVSQSEAAIHLAHGDALGACGLQVCQPYQPGGNQIQGPGGPHSYIAKGERLLVSPNPAGSEITVTMPSSPEATQLEIQNSLGVKVMREELIPETDRHTVDVSKLPPGIYFISIQGGQPVQFIKQ